MLVTDAIVDPDPKDWPDVPSGWDVRSHSMRKTVELVREMQIPLYVMLIGDPAGDVAGRDREQSPGFVLDLVQAANGAAAAPLAQTVAAFFKDDGMLLRKFVYRVAPAEGLAKIEPVVRRIDGSAARRDRVQDLRLLRAAAAADPGGAPGTAGALVPRPRRPGDRRAGASTSRYTWRRTRSTGLPTAPGRPRASRWSKTRARPPPRFTLQAREPDLTGIGLDTSGLDPRDAALLRTDLDGVRRALEAATDSGTREDKIHALNLDYAARGLDSREAERLLLSSPAERARIPALDFVRAKTHLAFTEDLRQRLVEPRVQLVTYGKDAARQELAQGASLRIGRYGFVVRELARGGRKDARLVLYYDRVPSLLGLKTILPDVFQRAFRFRRSRQRVVS